MEMKGGLKHGFGLVGRCLFKIHPDKNRGICKNGGNLCNDNILTLQVAAAVEDKRSDHGLARKIAHLKQGRPIDLSAVKNILQGIGILSTDLVKCMLNAARTAQCASLPGRVHEVKIFVRENCAVLFKFHRAMRMCDVETMQPCNGSTSLTAGET